MAVTEIALIHLKTHISPATKANLLEAQKAQTEYSTHDVNFLHQIEDSSFYYLLGGWESVETHTQEWIQSETNQKLLGQLGQDFDVCWMIHLNLDPSCSTIPLGAPVIAISRYFVKAEEKDRFDAAFKAIAVALGTSTVFPYCGAWRIDKDGDDEEFVLFSGWNELRDHFAFTESEASREFGKIAELQQEAEMKHVRLQEW